MNDEKAIALAYRKGDTSPQILAQGKGQSAEILCQIARRSGVPIIESQDLTQALNSLKPFDTVPEKYWFAIAEILQFVYKTREC